MASAPVVQHNSSSGPWFWGPEKKLSLALPRRTLNVYIIFNIYNIYIYIHKYIEMSVAVGAIWPSLFHGSEGKKTKTTDNQPAGHILEALTFAFPAVGITTSTVAICCMTFP